MWCMLPFLIDLYVPLFHLVHLPVFFNLFQNMSHYFWKSVLIGLRVLVLQCFHIVVQIVQVTGWVEKKHACDVSLAFEMCSRKTRIFQSVGRTEEDYTESVRIFNQMKSYKQNKNVRNSQQVQNQCGHRQNLHQTRTSLIASVTPTKHWASLFAPVTRTKH